jgi:hypothetical protein
MTYVDGGLDSFTLITSLVSFAVSYKHEKLSRSTFLHNRVIEAARKNKIKYKESE